MADRSEALPAGGLTREEVALSEVGHTTVSPAVVRFLVTVFLAAIFSVPLLETAGARARGAEAPRRPWSRLTDRSVRVPPAVADAASAGASWWQKIRIANREVLAAFNALERDLDDQSAIGSRLRRPAQRLLTAWLGTGNEQVYPGRDGWLFYRPDVEAVIGRGFLDPRQQRRRAAAASEWTAVPGTDPLPAILQFDRDLRSRGITLVVVPTPVKPGVHPEMLARRYPPADGVLQNRSYPDFVRQLSGAGVLVFDPGPGMAEERHAGPQYLETDTHWLPEAMEAVAERLARFIESRVQLPSLPDPGHRIERVEIRNAGDTARMLDLAQDDPLFLPESVWLRRVLLPDGSLWRSSRSADVLLLGDSFTNIYTLESMGWGTSAGFAEQVSYALRRPLDRLVQNDNGAFATRRMVQQEPGRLDGKRLVIYQFAVRELAFGDWRILPLDGVQR